MINCNILNQKKIYKTIAFVYFLSTPLTLLHNTSNNTQQDNNKYSHMLPELQEGYETERLHIRRTIEDDIETLGELFYDKNINTKIVPIMFNSDGFNNVEQSIEHINSEFKKETDFFFTICLKNSNIIIGAIDFSFNDSKDYVNVVYWIGTEYQNRGYMSELALDFIKYIFVNSLIRVLHIQCFANNEPSWQICCKIANNFEKDNNVSKQLYTIKQYTKKLEYKKNFKTDINILEITKNNT